MTLAAPETASAEEGLVTGDPSRRGFERERSPSTPSNGHATAHAPRRSAELLDAGTHPSRLALAESTGALAVAVDFASTRSKPSSQTWQTRPAPLADMVDEAIERALATRGAPDAGLIRHGEMRVEPATRLGDQLHRARRTGAASLILALTNVRMLVADDGALAPDDARALRFWTGPALDRTVTVLLDAADRDVPSHAVPIPLALALGLVSRAEPTTMAAILAPPSTDAEPAPSPPQASSLLTFANANARPRAAEKTAKMPSTPATKETATQLPLSHAPRIRIATSSSASSPLVATPASTPTPSPTKQLMANGIAVATDDDRWRSWMLALYAARGPQSLSSFERLFAEAYVPLTRALAEGLEAPKASQAVDEFRRNFARMYAEACPTFALTGKRPRMVMDAWDHAGKLSRLHNARGTQLLLVDGMRWDVGQEAKEVAVEILGARASLADERILWSALPTTTPRQLATLARGMDALRSDDEGDGEAEPVRGRTADVVRRMRVGSRDLYKLDLVEARLNHAPLADIARAAGESIARHALVLPPRTLLFVFGDHGFRGGASPSEKADHGGTSPEEVLVPSFAFVVGELH